MNFTDNWGNVYEKCPICTHAHKDVHSLGACYVRRQAAWRRARSLDGVRVAE